MMKFNQGLNIIEGDKLKRQIEFLLGKKVKLSAEEINKIAHLSVGNQWVLKVLDKLSLTIDDIVYEEDRDVLRRLEKNA